MLYCAYWVIVCIKNRVNNIPFLITAITSFLAITAAVVLYYITDGAPVLVIPFIIFFAMQLWMRNIINKHKE